MGEGTGSGGVLLTLIPTIGGIVVGLITFAGILVVTYKRPPKSDTVEASSMGSTVSSLAAVITDRDHIIDEQGQRIHVLEAQVRSLGGQP